MYPTRKRRHPRHAFSLRFCRAKFLQDQRGTTAVLFAIAVLPVILVIGAAADYKQATVVRSRLQQAVDAAALAAAGQPSLEQTQRVGIAQNAVLANLSTSASVNRVTAENISVTEPSANTYEVSATAQVPTAFMKIVRMDTVPVSTTARAALQSLGNLCVLGLNSFDSGAFDINGNAQFRSPSCVIQANSGSTQAVTQVGNAHVTSKAFGVRGGFSGSGYTPLPMSGARKIEDPYAASFTFPSYDFCADTKHPTQIKNDTTLSPGTYCGGVDISSGAKVTLLSGVYVMNGGPLFLKGGSRVTGDQVVIAFTGEDSTLWMVGNSTMSITSPASGTYTNMQFVQDPAQPLPKGGLWFSVGGSNGSGSSEDTSKLTYDGVLYLPTQNVWIYGGVNVEANSPSLAIVAGQIWTQGNATVTITTNNPRHLTVQGAPQLFTSARLVQ